LVAVCTLFNTYTLAPAFVLRWTLQRKVAQLKKDDAAIRREGFDLLTKEELRAACLARGICPSENIGIMKDDIEQWLILTLDHNVWTSSVIIPIIFFLMCACTFLYFCICEFSV
jgi:LETM1 and EF-hand domain-containing protein 1